MLKVTEHSTVGVLEFNVDETTGEVSGTRFYAEGTPEWSGLPFLNEALFDAFANQDWKSINEALAKNQVPADVYGAVYNNLDEWDDTPRDMNQALMVYICLLIKELAQRGLAFSRDMLQVYGYTGADSTKNQPRVNRLDVYSLLNRNMQLDYGTASVCLDTAIKGGVSMTVGSDLYGNEYHSFESVGNITEELVEKALLGVEADEETAKHLAAAVNRMILVNPDRFHV